MNIRIYTNVPKTEYAICCEGDQVMRAVTATGIQYTELEGQYVLEWDSSIEELPAAAVLALGLTLDPIEGSDLYLATCPLCGRETKSEWIEVTLSASESLITDPGAMGGEICIVGHLHYNCDEEAE